MVRCEKLSGEMDPRQIMLASYGWQPTKAIDHVQLTFREGGPAIGPGWLQPRRQWESHAQWVKSLIQRPAFRVKKYTVSKAHQREENTVF